MWRIGGINLAALVCIQAANAIIPLLIVPLVLSRLGSHAYAQLAVAEAGSMLVLALVLFSFEVDGVARVAGFSPANDRPHLEDALSDLVSARLVLFAVGAIAAIAIGICTGSGFPTLLALYLLVPLGHAFHCYWFYQGIERNIIPAVATVMARLVSFVLVLTLVQDIDDQVLVPLFIGVPFLFAGVVSLVYAQSALGLRVRWRGLRRVFQTIRHGREIFVGNAAVSLYREMNVVLLSIAGVAAPGIAAYSLVEKMVKMIQACTRPLSQFFFPKVLRSIADCKRPSPDAARRVAPFAAYQTGIMVFILIAIPIGYAVIAPHWAWLAQFGAIPGVTAMFIVMAPATLFGLANFMFGSAALNYLGARRYLLFSILGTGLASVTLCLVLAAYLGAMAGAICFLFSEGFLFILVIGRFLTWHDDRGVSRATT
jgi:PST family polysaccharide transporter